MKPITGTGKYARTETKQYAKGTFDVIVIEVLWETEKGEETHELNFAYFGKQRETMPRFEVGQQVEWCGFPAARNGYDKWSFEYLRAVQQQGPQTSAGRASDRLNYSNKPAQSGGADLPF